MLNCLRSNFMNFLRMYIATPCTIISICKLNNDITGRICQYNTYTVIDICSNKSCIETCYTLLDYSFAVVPTMYDTQPCKTRGADLIYHHPPPPQHRSMSPTPLCTHINNLNGLGLYYPSLFDFMSSF